MAAITKTRLKYFRGFSVARPHRFDEMFSKNKREREESRARINTDKVARKIA